MEIKKVNRPGVFPTLINFDERLEMIMDNSGLQKALETMQIVVKTLRANFRVAAALKIKLVLSFFAKKSIFMMTDKNEENLDLASNSVLENQILRMVMKSRNCSNRMLA